MAPPPVRCGDRPPAVRLMTFTGLAGSAAEPASGGNGPARRIVLRVDQGQPIVFSHGWPLSAYDWDTQMMFFLGHGYVFDGLQQQVATRRSEFYREFASGPFYNFNRKKRPEDLPG
jgi:pimeloyl-ACP methyl ester carboxylesterase